MKHLIRRALAGGVAATVLLAPTAVLATDDPEPETTEEAILEQVEQAATEAGLSPTDILTVEVTLTTTGPDGEPQEHTVSFAELVEQVGGGSLSAGQGWQGLPWTNAGNLMHVYVDIAAGAFPTGTRTADAVAPELSPLYDVVEAEITPSTPIVPGINPLLLTDLEAPVDLPALLAMHWGGKLKSIRGSGWDTGFHGAGTGLVGSNVDTAERPAEDEATFPFSVPFVDEGDTSVADTEIDFLGYAMVVEGSGCSIISVTLFGTSYALGYACVGFGTLLGDGVSFFDGDSPVDVRDSLAPVWEPAPEELQPVLDAVDEALAQVPVDELTEQVLDAVGGVEVPETPEPAVASVVRGLRLR